MVEASRLVGWWAAGWANQSFQVEVTCCQVDSCFGYGRLPVGVGRNPGWRSRPGLSPVPFCSASSADEGS